MGASSSRWARATPRCRSSTLRPRRSRPPSRRPGRWPPSPGRAASTSPFASGSTPARRSAAGPTTSGPRSTSRRGFADRPMAGQIFLSSVSADLVAARLPEGCELVDVGPHRLKGLAAPERIHALKGPGRRRTPSRHGLPVSRPAGLRDGGSRVLLRARGRGAGSSRSPHSRPARGPGRRLGQRQVLGPQGRSGCRRRGRRGRRHRQRSSRDAGRRPQARSAGEGERAGDRRPVRGAVHAVPRPRPAARLHRRAARPSRARGDRRARRPLRPAQHPRRPRPRSRRQPDPARRDDRRGAPARGDRAGAARRAAPRAGTGRARAARRLRRARRAPASLPRAASDLGAARRTDADGRGLPGERRRWLGCGPDRRHAGRVASHTTSVRWCAASSCG